MSRSLDAAGLEDALYRALEKMQEALSESASMYEQTVYDAYVEGDRAPATWVEQMAEAQGLADRLPGEEAEGLMALVARIERRARALGEMHGSVMGHFLGARSALHVLVMELCKSLDEGSESQDLLLDGVSGATDYWRQDGLSALRSRRPV